MKPARIGIGVFLTVVGLVFVGPLLRNAATTIGPQFSVNSYTTDSQRAAAVSSLPNGDIVVVWESLGQEGDFDRGIFGRRFDSAAGPLGVEFQVNTFTTDDQRRPAVTSLDGGGFVVAWESYEQAGNTGYGVFARIFDDLGAPAGPEFQLNTTTIDERIQPSLAPASVGGFVAAWSAYEDDGDSYGVTARRFDSAGVEVQAEFLVNTYTTDSQSRPAVDSAADGRFVVVWESYSQDASLTSGIFGQLFDSAGVPIGTEFRVNIHTADDQSRPDVAMTADGRFVVVWQSYSQGMRSDYDIFARAFTTAGVPAGTEFRVNDYTPNEQNRASIAAAADSGFLVTWQSYEQLSVNYSVFGRRLDDNAAPIGTEFAISADMAGDQVVADVASMSGSGFVVAWQPETIDADYEIVAQRITGGQICGDADGGQSVNATDALIALRTGVGADACLPCACDVNSTDDINATDALDILRFGVGQPVALTCPAC